MTGPRTHNQKAQGTEKKLVEPRRSVEAAEEPTELAKIIRSQGPGIGPKPGGAGSEASDRSNLISL